MDNYEFVEEIKKILKINREFDFNEFNTNINKYADKYRKVIISFDNKPVDEIDFSLYNRHKIYSGKSGFKKLHKEDTEVFESLYVSKK